MQLVSFADWRSERRRREIRSGDAAGAFAACRAVGDGAAPDPPRPAYLDKNAVQLTVTLPSGESVSGALVRLTDFDVTLYDPKTGQIRSWLRNGDVPKVVVTDPLQAHVDMWTKWTDADMHNMTAYLASLK